MKKFLVDNAVTLLFGLILALVTYIGKNQLDGIKQEMDGLQEDVSRISVDARMTDISNVLISKEISDLKMTDSILRDIDIMKDMLGPYLRKGEKGKVVLSQLEGLSDGLKHYITRDYKAAKQDFEKLDVNHSLAHRLKASAIFRLAEGMSPAQETEAQGLRKTAEAEFDAALDLARTELLPVTGESILIKMEARSYMILKTAEGDEKAIGLLQQLVVKNYADHNTFYNLSALYSRKGDLDNCIINFKMYIEKGGAFEDKRNVPDSDPDFDFVRKSNRSGEFLACVNQMRS